MCVHSTRSFFACSISCLSGLFASLGITACLAQPPRGGGPNAPDIELVKDFDADGDGILNAVERKKALAKLESRSNRGGGPGFGGPGGRSRGGGPGRGPGGPRGGAPAGKPGPHVLPSDVENIPDADLYDVNVLRTLFLEFEQKNWEQELAAFKPTDVEIPATLTVDGKAYPNVGVSFRGSSSFFMVPEGNKRSLNLSMDFIDEDQRLYDYKSLNLLNCNGDPSMMSSLLYAHIAGQKIATPKVNFVKVIINGRSWGVYANSQQFNKDFLKDNYDTKKGARWKVSGNPNADAGLRYLGEDLQPYRTRFEIKSKDEEKPWRDLVSLCKTLEQTPPDALISKLDPILDLDGVLWFLAVDVALINSDGYWTRASDYNMYQGKQGKFHILPHDMNEAFRGSRGGPGGGGPGGPRGGGPPSGLFGNPLELLFGPPQGPGGDFGPPDRGNPRNGTRTDERNGRERGGRGGFRSQGNAAGFELDPLVGLDNDRFPLRSKLLANQVLRTRYLQYVREIARDYLDWNHLGPHIAGARELIQAEVQADTRKLQSYEAFLEATDDRQGGLREFCEKRAAYLLGLDVIRALPRTPVPLPSQN